jgi:hypothetical protein
MYMTMNFNKMIIGDYSPITSKGGRRRSRRVRTRKHKRSNKSKSNKSRTRRRH